MLRWLACATLILTCSGCAWLSSFVYTIDVPQGNFLEQRDVDKLRIGMSEEQVTFVLGTPMVVSSFSNNDWHYLYQLRTGKGEIIRKELVVSFNAERKLAAISGDFEQPADFTKPLGP